MKKVAISEFRAKCSALLNEMQKTKKPIRITRFGRAIADVVPISAAQAGDWMGSMKDRIEFLGDIVSPADEE